MPTYTPDLPFIEVASDIFNFEAKQYLLTVDYYSKFVELDCLKDVTARSVIEALKQQFCRHGIPKKLQSYSGSQCMSEEFSQFCKGYGIAHDIVSPKYQRDNGEAERAIQTVKRLWKKSVDKYLALLDYRTTPLGGINLSPAQLLMGRRPRNTLPCNRTLLMPARYDHHLVRSRLDAQKEKQKHYHDKPSMSGLPPLQPGDNVRMLPNPEARHWIPAVVAARHNSPRSYLVRTPNNVYRRNRLHLRRVPHSANVGPVESQPPSRFYSSQDMRDFPDPTAQQDTPVENCCKSPSPSEQESESQSFPTVSSPRATASPRNTKFITRSGRAVNPPRRLDL